MRHLYLLVLFLILAATPVVAQDGSQQAPDERRMSGNLCSKRFMCNDVYGGSTIADSCLTEIFGNSAKDVTFSSASLESDGCMRVNYFANDNNDKSQNSQKYRCCIMHVNNSDICQYRCDIIIVR